MYSFRLGVGKQGYTLKSRGVLFKRSPPQDSGLEQYFKKSPPGDSNVQPELRTVV